MFGSANKPVYWKAVQKKKCHNRDSNGIICAIQVIARTVLCGSDFLEGLKREVKHDSAEYIWLFACTVCRPFGLDSTINEDLSTVFQSSSVATLRISFDLSTWTWSKLVKFLLIFTFFFSTLRAWRHNAKSHLKKKNSTWEDFVWISDDWPTSNFFDALLRLFCWYLCNIRSIFDLDY